MEGRARSAREHAGQRGFPYLTVNDGDYLKNNELYIKHWYEGIELDLKYLEKVFAVSVPAVGQERAHRICS